MNGSKFWIGDAVFLTDDMTGTVTQVRFDGAPASPLITYLVEWWDHRTRCSEVFAEWQLTPVPEANQ